MISTRWRPRTARLLVAALVLSLLIHFFGFVLVRLALRVFPKPNATDVRIAQRAIPEPITIEKIVVRPTPTPTPPPPAAAPRPSAHRPGSGSPRKAAASVHAAPQAAPVTVYHQHAHRSPNHLALAPRTSGAAPTGTRPSERLTSDQIAKLETQFSQTIADSRQDVASAVNSVHEPVGGATFHYSAENGNMTIGSGNWRVNSSQPLPGGRIAYQLHYTYVTTDGSVEQGDVPWPFIYSRDDDPFKRGVKQISWQCPPPGFVATESLTPQETFTIDVCLGNRPKP